MSSSNLNNSNNSITEPTTLCSNGCGFFGSVATKGYCSKCYNDFIKSIAQPLLPDTFLTLKQTSNPTLTLKQTSNSIPSVNLNQDFSITSPSSSSAIENTIVKNEDETITKKKNRCGKCNKKVGLIGFQCKCGNMFCGSHRYAEAHECNFDFKAKGRSEMAKVNPLVKADKLERL